MRLVNGKYEPTIAANNIAFDTLWLYSEVLELELHLIAGELRFRDPQTGEFLKTHKEEKLGRLAAESAFEESEQERLAEQQARLAAEPAFQQSDRARWAAESALRAIVTQLLNSGINLEQVAQMTNLPTLEVQRLVGGN